MFLLENIKSYKAVDNRKSPLCISSFMRSWRLSRKAKENYLYKWRFTNISLIRRWSALLWKETAGFANPRSSASCWQEFSHSDGRVTRDELSELTATVLLGHFNQPSRQFSLKLKAEHFTSSGWGGRVPLVRRRFRMQERTIKTVILTQQCVFLYLIWPLYNI